MPPPMPYSDERIDGETDLNDDDEGDEDDEDDEDDGIE